MLSPFAVPILPRRRDRRLIGRVRESVIGEDAVLDGPFGPRRMVYADYTASARGLWFPLPGEGRRHAA